MKRIAIIPARGGSKRIPRKNIKDFLGKPIIAYSIEVALKSALFDEVMVSTDDLEIADISIKYGASVPFLRSEKNSNDLATTVDALKEVIENYRILENKEFQSICCIYPTAPLIDVKRIIEGEKLLNQMDFDSVFPIVEFSYPVWRGLTYNSGKVEMKWSEYYNSRSQDLEPLYHDAGQWYWINTKSLIKQNKLYMENSHGICLSELEVQDIDSLTDFKLAEIKFKELHK